MKFSRRIVVECARCSERKIHKARGLCNGCYKTASKDGTRDHYPVQDRAPRIHCMRCGRDGREHVARQLCPPCHRKAERLGVLDFYPHVDNSLPPSTTDERLDQLLRDRRS